MAEKTLISIIVPVYNVERFLPRCLESLMTQTYETLEIILVDDGATDSSGAICDEYAAKDPRITVIHKKNGGLSSARNAGMEIARGEYIGFVDSDDWIEPEMYGHMLSLAKKNDVKLVCAGRYDVEESTGEKTVGLCPEKEEVVTGEELVGRIFTWDGLDSAAWDKLYHRSILQNFRYPLGKICEDVPVTYRIVLEAGKAVLCDRPFYNYLHRAGSITKTKTISEKNFHLSEHTAVIYPWIRENRPALEPQAAYLRVSSLVHILLLLDQAKPEVRKQFENPCRKARKELGKFTRFILRSPYFGTKERIRDLLLILNLYRILRPVFHR